MSAASTAEAAGGPAATPPHPAPAPAGLSRVLVVGLGNPLLGDDGVGWLVVQAVERATAGLPSTADGSVPRAAAGGVAFDCLAVGGLALMERLVGARRAILVDAVVSGRDPAGTVRLLGLESLPGREAGHLDSAHDVTLRVALDAGRALGAALPDEIAIVTIEAERVGEFSETLTPAVAAAIPLAAGRVLALIANG